MICEYLLHLIDQLFIQLLELKNILNIAQTLLVEGHGGVVAQAQAVARRTLPELLG